MTQNSQIKRPTRTRVVFRLIGDELEPERITEALGVMPTKAWRKGDVRRSTQKSHSRYTFGCWLLESTSLQNDSFEHQLTTLLDQLEALPPILYTFIETLDAEISVSYKTDESNFGFSLDRLFIERMSKLKISIDISVYAVGVGTAGIED